MERTTPTNNIEQPKVDGVYYIPDTEVLRSMAATVIGNVEDLDGQDVSGDFF